MLSDAELTQMLADAAEMRRIREAATECIGNFTVSDPYGYDAMFCDVIAEGATVPCIQGCHHTVVELLAAAARSDNSADHVERLVQEVKALHKQIATLTAERDAAVKLGPHDTKDAFDWAVLKRIGELEAENARLTPSAPPSPDAS